MAELEYHKVLQKCWDNEVFVVQKPTNIGMVSGGHKVKLNLEINGQIAKFGTKEYKQNSNELIEKIEEIYRYQFERMT